MALDEEAGDRRGAAAALDRLGCAHYHLGDHDQAIDCYRRALRLFSDLGDRYEEACTLNRLGDTSDAAGDRSAGRDAWQQALAILQDLGHRDAPSIGAKLTTLGH